MKKDLDLDPGERLKAGRIAARERRYADALREYVWFHDNALKHEPAFYGVRLSFALADWVELGESFPEARRKLEEIRDRKAAMLVSGQGDRRLFHDVASINQFMDAELETYRLFTKMLRTAPLNAIAWADMAREAIVKARDFGLAAKYSDPPEELLLRYSDSLNRDVAGLSGDRKRRALVLNAYVHIYVDRVAITAEILEGLGMDDDARACREWAIALVDSRAVRKMVGDALL